jgi:hypothetical protein
LFERLSAVLVLGLLLELALGWPKIVAVWQGQLFSDTDDAMHMVVLRDWLAGQAWYDTTAYRLDPPHGVLMHWTHVLDLPMGLLVRLFAFFTPEDRAETLMRIVYPILLQIPFFAASIAIARKLMGPSGMSLAALLTALSLTAITQFLPGRINHHNAQIVLLLGMLWATLDLFDPRLAWRGALAGLFAALSLSISIENLPFILAMLAVAGIAWLSRGAAMAKALVWLGAGLAGCTLVAFLATIPPQRYGADVCDAFGGAHLIGALAGGVGLVLLGLATPRLPGVLSRLAGAAVAAAAALAAVAFTFPDCLHDPHSAVDPLLREVWLANVQQARPLVQLLRFDFLGTLPTVMPIALGLVFGAVAAWRATGTARARWLAVVAFIAVGLLGACWEVRVAPSIASIALFGGVWLIGTFYGGRWPLVARFLGAVTVALSLTPMSWAAAVQDVSAAGPTTYGDPAACFASSAFAALDRLPPGSILAPIDTGAHILAFTHHTVFGAPYHRNNHGNRLSVDFFLADPQEAKGILRRSGARYLAFCPAAEELGIYASRAPAGMTALLRAGKVPDWLQPIALSDTPYRVFVLK